MPLKISQLVKLYTRRPLPDSEHHEYIRLWFEPDTLRFFFGEHPSQFHLNPNVADKYQNISGAGPRSLEGSGAQARQTLCKQMLETESWAIFSAYEACRTGGDHVLKYLLSTDEARPGKSYDYLAALMAAVVKVSFELDLIGIEHPTIPHERRNIFGILPQ